MYIGGGANVFGTVDLATGAVTALATDNPQGEFEGAVQVGAGEILSCNGPVVQFEDGIPMTWTNLDNGGPFAWVTTADATVTIGPANDQCVNAEAMACPGGGGATSDLGTTNDATFSNAGTCTTTHTAPEVWYYIVGNGGDMTVDTCIGTSYDTKISVWEGSCGSLVCVAGNDDDCGLQSSVTWTSTPGTDDYVMVHGFSSSTGDFELTLTCAIPVELQAFTIE